MIKYEIKRSKISRVESNIEILKNGELFISSTNPCTTIFKESKYDEFILVVAELYTYLVNNGINENDMDNLIKYIINRDEIEFFNNNYKRIIISIIDIIINKRFKDLNLDFNKFIDLSKKTKTSTFMDYDNILDLIKIIIINKIFFNIIITSDNLSKSFNTLKALYIAVGINEDTLDKLYNIIKSQIKKCGFTNKYLWEIYQYEFGKDNFAFIFNIFTQVTTRYSLVYNLDQDETSPMSYLISNINNQIKWWLDNHFGNIRMLSVDNESIDGLFSSAIHYSPNQKQISVYKKVQHKKFIQQTVNFLMSYKIDENDLNKIKETLKTHKLSIISKYLLSYFVSEIFDFDFESILNIILINDQIANRFLLIIKTIYNELKSELNEVAIDELNIIFASLNLFIPHNTKDNYFINKNDIVLDPEYSSIMMMFISDPNFKHIEKPILSIIFNKIDKNLYVRKNMLTPLFQPTTVIKNKVKEVKHLSTDRYIKEVIIKLFHKMFSDSISSCNSIMSEMEDNVNLLDLILQGFKKYIKR